MVALLSRNVPSGLFCERSDVTGNPFDWLLREKQYKTSYSIALVSSVRALEVKAIEFHRMHGLCYRELIGLQVGLYFAAVTTHALTREFSQRCLNPFTAGAAYLWGFIFISTLSITF